MSDYEQDDDAMEIDVEDDDYDNCWKNDEDYDFVDDDAEDEEDEDGSDSMSSAEPSDEEADENNSDGENNDNQSDGIPVSLRLTPSSASLKRRAEDTIQSPADKRVKTSIPSTANTVNQKKKRRPNKPRNWGNTFLTA